MQHHHGAGYKVPPQGYAQLPQAFALPAPAPLGQSLILYCCIYFVLASLSLVVQFIVPSLAVEFIAMLPLLAVEFIAMLWGHLSSLTSLVVEFVAMLLYSSFCSFRYEYFGVVVLFAFALYCHYKLRQQGPPPCQERVDKSDPIDPKDEQKEYVNIRPTYGFYRGWCEGCEMWCARRGFGMSTQGRCTCSTDGCWSCRQKQAPACTQCAIPVYDYATHQPRGYLPCGAKVRVVGVNVKDGQNSTPALIDYPNKAVVRVTDIQDCGLCIPLNALEHEAERLCFEALAKALHNFPEEIVNTIQQFVGKFDPECPLNLVRKKCGGLILYVDPTSTLDYGGGCEAKREIEEREGWFDSKNQLLPKEKLVEIDQFMTELKKNNVKPKSLTQRTGQCTDISENGGCYIFWDSCKLTPSFATDDEE